LAKHILWIEGERFEVDVGERLGEHVQVRVNGACYEVEIGEVQEGEGSEWAPASAFSGVFPSLQRTTVPVPQTSRRPGSTRPPPTGAVCAPLAGLVLEIRVKPGDRVAAGDVVVVLEAMKMENPIVSQQPGIVTSVRVQPRDTVDQGAVLIEIATPGAPT